MIARRRVLFVLPSLGGGGAERVMLTVLRHLDRSRFEPHLALVTAAGPYLRDVPADVPIHDLKASRVRYALPALVRLAWKLRPPVMLSTLSELNLAIILAKPFLPRESKLLVREVAPVGASLRQRGRTGKMWEWLYGFLYRRARIICLSDHMLNDLAEHFGVPREKMVRIYNPVDVDRVRMLAEAGPNPFTGGGPHVVAAGRLSLEKGFDLLLDAMAQIRPSVPEADLTILGDGPLEYDLKDQSERLGLTPAVHFVGFQSNPYPYFKHADLFVLSSRYEGLPNVLLEALALGTPVVATDCPGGVKEILDGCARGWLTAYGDAQRLAETIVKALACGEKRSPVEVLEGPLEKFTIERAVREYEAVLSR